MDLDCNAFHVGDRSGQSAQALWEQIPAVSQERATFFTDQYEVYKGVIPAAQHRAMTKLALRTNHMERFNCTLRQRVFRLVRATLSFSKNLVNHIGAIKYFICDCNLTKSEHYQNSTTHGHTLGIDFRFAKSMTGLSFFCKLTPPRFSVELPAPLSATSI